MIELLSLKLTKEALSRRSKEKIRTFFASAGLPRRLRESLIPANLGTGFLWLATIISNFSQIVSYLRRKPEHVEKFLEKELAAQGKPEKGRLTLIRKIPSKKIQEKLNFYVERYVLCKECGKPDTELLKEGNFFFIHCLACGAKHSIPKI